MRKNKNIILAAVAGILLLACAEKEKEHAFPWITDVNASVEAKGRIVGYEIFAKW